jgi:hypothetical protein
MVVRHHPMHIQTRRSTVLLFHKINRIAEVSVGAGRSGCLCFSLLRQFPANEYKLVAYSMRSFSIFSNTIGDQRAWSLPLVETFTYAQLDSVQATSFHC